MELEKSIASLQRQIIKEKKYCKELTERKKCEALENKLIFDSMNE